jgi:hypothetical protein
MTATNVGPRPASQALRHERHRRPLRPPPIRVSYLPHQGGHWPLAIRPIRAHAANRFTAHQRAVELRDGT